MSEQDIEVATGQVDVSVYLTPVSGVTYTLHGWAGDCIDPTNNQDTENCTWNYDFVEMQLSGTPSAINMPTPTGLAAVPGDEQATLTWSPVSGATKYWIYGGAQGAETVMGSATGTSYTATLLLNKQTIYFKVMAVSDSGASDFSNEVSAYPISPLTPNITTISPASGPPGTVITLAGTFGPFFPYKTYPLFHGSGIYGASWTDTTVSFQVPTNTTGGNVNVAVMAKENVSNSVPFSVTGINCAGQIYSTYPSTGLSGTLITVYGTGFGDSQANSTISFNGVLATPTAWSNSEIDVPVPAGATTGNIVVTAGADTSNGKLFTVTTAPPPSISTVSPTSGSPGTSVTISGSNFGATQGSSTVSFNGVSAAPSSWSNSTIVVPVPLGSATGDIVVNVNGAPTSGVLFTVTAPAAATIYHYSITQADGTTSGYAPNGNIQAYTDSVNGNWGWNGALIQYDNLNRLISANVTPAGGSATQSWCWTYDSFGNRTREQNSPSALPSDCSIGSNAIVQSLGFNEKNRITSSSSALGAPSYDDAGEVTDDGNFEYKYDAEGRVCAVHQYVNNRLTGYIYDADGNRVAKGTLGSFSCV